MKGQHARGRHVYQQVDAAAGRRAVAHCAKHYRVPENVAFVEPDMWPQQPGF